MINQKIIISHKKNKINLNKMIIKINKNNKIKIYNKQIIMIKFKIKMNKMILNKIIIMINNNKNKNNFYINYYH